MSGSRFLSKRHAAVEKCLAQQVKIVIVCEGKKTEPDYFDSYVVKHFREARNIKVVPNTKGKTSLNQLYAAALDNKSRYPNAVVFMVFDNDGKLSNKTQKKQLCTVLSKCAPLGSVSQDKVNFIFSNPQFELWAILHFEYTTAALTKKETERRTKRYFPDYNPKDNKTFDYNIILRSPESEQCAIKYAKKLRKHHIKIEGECFFDCPTTNVDVLIEYMERVCQHRPD